MMYGKKASGKMMSKASKTTKDPKPVSKISRIKGVEKKELMSPKGATLKDVQARAKMKSERSRPTESDVYYETAGVKTKRKGQAAVAGSYNKFTSMKTNLENKKAGKKAAESAEKSKAFKNSFKKK